MSRGRFNKKVFYPALLASVAFHVFVLVPRLLKPLLERREAPIEVEYVAELSDAPAAPEPADENQPPDENSPAERAKAKKPVEPPPRPAPSPPPVAAVEPPQPEEPKPPQPELPKPVPLQPMPRLLMVDQDRGAEEPDNAEAHFLAQKNHRATEDRRALDTNLIRNATPDPSTPRPSTPSPNLLPEAGDADRKLGDLHDQAGDPKRLPRSQPIAGADGAAPPEKEKKALRPGPLAMRDLVPRAAEPVEAVKPREGLELQERGPGPLPEARVGQDGERARAAARGGQPRVKLQLDHTDYDKIEGFAAADKERQQAARGERSHSPGHWDKVQSRLASLRSSLENFTPDVRPGNEAELGTRAHPFAAYIAGMHRQIHRLWAFGFISDIEARLTSVSYSDPALWTQLEIVLKDDGTVEKITIVRGSGESGFDVAAIDSVAAAAPFPPPPQSIKSANGKVYVDWRFHRDDRLCSALYSDPHILTTVGDNKVHDTSAIAGGERETPPPRVLRRSRGATSFAPAPAAPPPSAAAPGDEVSATVPDGARDAAQGWFAAYVRGDPRWLAGWSAAPFTTGGLVSAKDGSAVKQLYADLIHEAPADRRLDKIETLTAAGIRARLGGLPPGGEGDGKMFYAIGKVGGDEFVLLLKKSDQGWRVAGLDR